MSSAAANSHGATTTPLLEVNVIHEEESRRLVGWFKRFLDLEEAKTQLWFSFPMILTNVSYYAIALISVMFAGHLGELQLAGATLANSWSSVTGVTVMIGLSGALETLCGQGFGAKLYRMLGIYLQSACIISFFFSIIVSVLWVYTEPILILLHQDARIAKEAALYMRYFIPGVFAYGFLQNILRFMQTQSVVTPLIVLAVLPVLIHIGIAYSLIHLTTLGFKGAPLAASISLWIAVLMLAIYVVSTKKFEHTWKGFSFEPFSHILTYLKVALPSAAMVCLEYWAFEILVLLAGLLPNPETSTSLIAMGINTEIIAYLISYGLSAAASTRVSNELGAGNPERAKRAMVMTIKLDVLLVVAVVLALAFGHNIWASLFSNSATIINYFALLTPLLAISITVDFFQSILSGVARGSGWQHLAMYANLAAFYFIGIPIAILLGFKFKLHVKGLWIGLICGLFSQACTLLFIVLRRKWARIDLPDNED